VSRTAPPGGSPPDPLLRAPRAVPAAHAFAWYREAMRLWRASPGMFAVLAAIALAIDTLLRLVPVAGPLLAQLVLPLIECSLLYASLAADQGDKPRLRQLLAVAGAPPRALAALVLASLVAFAGQLIAATALTDVNLLQPASFTQTVAIGDLTAIIAAGIVFSLPVSFVAPIALFDNAGVATSFRLSMSAFTRNPMPLLIYAALALGLFVLGLLTSGLGLLLAVPWLASSSYAAWKDVFAVPGAGRRSP
jgi:uncharacterized membrane protein